MFAVADPESLGSSTAPRTFSKWRTPCLAKKKRTFGQLWGFPPPPKAEEMCSLICLKVLLSACPVYVHSGPQFCLLLPQRFSRTKKQCFVRSTPQDGPGSVISLGLSFLQLLFSLLIPITWKISYLFLVLRAKWVDVVFLLFTTG